MTKDWPARLAHAVGRNVRRIRESSAPKMTAQALADETARLGNHIQRPVLTNLENGRRASITLAELFVLANALQVPPFALLAPLVSDETVEVLPGETLSQWAAVDWFTGDRVVEDEAASPIATQITDAYQMRFAYRVATMQLIDASHRASRADGIERADALREVAAHRRYMGALVDGLTRIGVNVPDLREPIEHLSGLRGSADE